MLEFVGEFDFKPSAVGLVKHGAFQRFGQIGLPCRVGVFFVVRVTVAFAVTGFAVRFGRRIAQMQGNGIGGMFAHAGKRGFHRHVGSVAFRGKRQIGYCLCERQMPFGAAEALVCLVGVQRQIERIGVGIADIFAGHA